MKTFFLLASALFISQIIYGQDTAKKAKISDLDTLKKHGFSEAKIKEVKSDIKNYHYKESVTKKDTTTIVYKVKSHIDIKYENGYLVGEVTEKTKNLTNSKEPKRVTSATVKIKMIACCTAYGTHTQHCCNPDEIKDYTDKKGCKNWTLNPVN
ncbi:MAG: hypothetical protein ACXVB0_09815 [Mucilaginibacter sp.]